MTTDRVVCSQCGANNFATQAACWKCSASLVPRSAPVPAPVSVAAQQPASVGVRPAEAFVVPSPSPAPLWATIALGVFFPFISLPVGLIFLMLEDRRKTQIGWWNIVAGLVGSLVQLLITLATLMPVWNTFSRGLPLGGMRSSLSAPDPNAEVSQPELSGIPNAFSRGR